LRLGGVTGGGRWASSNQKRLLKKQRQLSSVGPLLCQIAEKRELAGGGETQENNGNTKGNEKGSGTGRSQKKKKKKKSQHTCLKLVWVADIRGLQQKKKLRRKWSNSEEPGGR